MDRQRHPVGPVGRARRMAHRQVFRRRRLRVGHGRRPAQVVAARTVKGTRNAVDRSPFAPTPVPVAFVFYTVFDVLIGECSGFDRLNDC